VQSVLTRHPNARVRVFIVWEPILPTDFSAPVTWVLGRAGDGRVQQYWDRNHVVAKRMAADARPPQPQPECCDQSGILWDLAAVYPKDRLWDQRMPAAIVFNGPVVDITAAIEAALVKQP
jgi:hypothetical protein